MSIDLLDVKDVNNVLPQELMCAIERVGVAR